MSDELLNLLSLPVSSLCCVCRICAVVLEASSTIDIFGLHGVGLAERINKYLPIQVNEHDPFPKTICENCALQLQKFEELVEKCVLFEKQLQKSLCGVDDIDASATLDVELESLKNSSNVDFDIQEFEDLGLLAAGSQENCVSGTPCQICQERLPSFEQCLQHQKMHINQGKCVICNYHSENEVETYLHFKKHFTLDPPEKRKKLKCHKDEKVCLKCNCSFYTVADVVAHCKGHRPTDISSFTCVLCLERVDDTALQEHIKNHFFPDSSSFSCEACFKKYLDEKSLKYHRCEVLRKFKCSECRLGFKTERRLNFHLEFHKTKQTICNICQKDFKFESRIFQHLSSVHQGERDISYCCDVCGKTFRCITDLQTHQRAHNDDRPFACGKCDARFFSKTSLSAHLPSHDATSLFHCLRCNYSTNRKENLVKHVARLHSQIDLSQVAARCLTCLEVFPNATHIELEKHVHKSSNSCSNVVEEITVTKLYQCERCHKNFASSEHLMHHRFEHSSNNPFYLCRICDAGFLKHDFLVRHQKKLHQGIISKYSGKFSVLTVTVCDICSLEWVHYKQLLNHKARGNCHKKKALGKIGISKIPSAPRLHPIKANQLNVNAAGLFECRECQRQYKSRRRYRLHIATHERIELN